MPMRPIFLNRPRLGRRALDIFTAVATGIAFGYLAAAGF